MTRNFSPNNVKNAAIRAMLEAGHEYANWTENRLGPSRARAPELFYQVKVAERIRQLPFNPAVFLEYNATDALKYNAEQVPQSRHGPLSKIPARNRNIDILVARKMRRNTPQPFRIALEIKRNAQKWDKIEKDVLRLSELVRTTGFQMGLSLFLTGHPEGARGKADFAQGRKDLKATMKRYEERNPDLKLSLLPLEKGGIRKFKTDEGGIRHRVWYVSGLDIRSRS